jgi:spermidine/putrescine transport system substrate-binding protein
MDQIYDKMINEEAWVAPYYAGDFVQMSPENEDLAFYLPEDDGFNLFIDAMCIPTCAEHKTEAELFINFLTDPEISAANMEWVGYASPVGAAKEYLDEEIATDPVVYPDDEQLTNGEMFLYLSTAATQEMDTLWLSVKTSSSNTTIYLVIGAIAVVVVVVLIVLLTKRKKKKKSRRGSSAK